MIPRIASTLRRWASEWPLAGALALVLAGQFFIISAGTWTLRLPDLTRNYTSYYFDWLADAFGQGQLNLLQEPPAALATLADPYDPAQREGLGAIHDAIYFNGKYYLSWGPVPALLLLGTYRLTGAADVPDSYLALTFAYGLTLVAAALFATLREWLFPDAPRWLPAAGLLTLGLGSPLLFMLARPAAYEAAILAGQFFLLGGLLAALLAICDRGRRAGAWLVAGAYWALAIGSRWNLLPGAALLVALFGLWAWRTLPRVRARSLALAAALAGPFLLGVLAMGAYNFLRFGGFFEMGQAYALSGINQRVVAEASRLLALPRALPALLDYLVQPPVLSWQFPWITATGPVGPWWGNQLRDVIREPLVGVAWSAPFALLVLAVPALWGAAGRKPNQFDPEESPTGVQEARWTAATLVLAVLAILVPLSLYLTVTMRYVADFLPLMVLLAYVTAGAVAAHRPRWRAGVLTVAAGLAVLSAVIGLLLGFTGHYEHFERHNPSLMAVLRGEQSLECYFRYQRGEAVSAAGGAPVALDDGCARVLPPAAIDSTNAPLQEPGQWPAYMLLGMNGEASYEPIEVAQGRLELALTAQGSVGGGRTPVLRIQLRDASGAAVDEQVIQVPANLDEVPVRLNVPQPGVYTLALVFQDDYFVPGEGDRNVLIYACRIRWVR